MTVGGIAELTWTSEVVHLVRSCVAGRGTSSAEWHVDSSRVICSQFTVYVLVLVRVSMARRAYRWLYHPIPSYQNSEQAERSRLDVSTESRMTLGGGGEASAGP